MKLLGVGLLIGWLLGLLTVFAGIGAYRTFSPTPVPTPTATPAPRPTSTAPPAKPTALPEPMPPNTAVELHEDRPNRLPSGATVMSGRVKNNAKGWAAADIVVDINWRSTTGAIAKTEQARIQGKTVIQPGEQTFWEYSVERSSDLPYVELGTVHWRWSRPPESGP